MRFIAVVGSREWKDKRAITHHLPYLGMRPNDVIITGGARGVDTWVQEWCDKHKYVCKIIRPIDPAKKLDYLFRNVEIITLSDKVLAFWDGKSKGTKFVIEYAQARKKPLEVVQMLSI